MHCDRVSRWDSCFASSSPDEAVRPTLTLWGTRDTQLPRGYQETLTAQIPGAALKANPNVAHLVLSAGARRKDAAAFFHALA